MSEADEAIKKFRELFQKSRLSSEIDIKNILVVVDETQERISFIFELISLLKKDIKATISFLLAVRGYFSQAKTKGVEVLTLSELVQKVKEKFVGLDEIYDVIFIPDEDIEPFERIKEVLNRVSAGLVIIPTPFTIFAEGESETPSSLGKTVDNVISSVLYEKKIPLLLVKEGINKSFPFKKVSILVRKPQIRKDLIGWILPIISREAEINIYHTEDIKEKEEQRIELFFQVLEEHVVKEGWNVNINHIPEAVSVGDFCYQDAISTQDFIIIQTLSTIPEDPEHIICALSFSKINVLLFPPLD